MGRLTGYERSILRLLLTAIRPARGPLHRVLRQRLTAVPCTLQAGSVSVWLGGLLARRVRAVLAGPLPRLQSLLTPHQLQSTTTQASSHPNESLLLPRVSAVSVLFSMKCHSHQLIIVREGLRGVWVLYTAVHWGFLTADYRPRQRRAHTIRARGAPYPITVREFQKTSCA